VRMKAERQTQLPVRADHKNICRRRRHRRPSISTTTSTTPFIQPGGRLFFQVLIPATAPVTFLCRSRYPWEFAPGFDPLFGRTQGYTGVHRGTQGYTGGHRGTVRTQGYSTHWHTQGYTDVQRGPRGTQGYTWVHGGTQGHTWIHMGAQGEHRGTQGYT
jgi:hypothetical protein